MSNRGVKYFGLCQQKSNTLELRQAVLYPKPCIQCSVLVIRVRTASPKRYKRNGHLTVNKLGYCRLYFLVLDTPPISHVHHLSRAEKYTIFLGLVLLYYP